MLVNLKITLEYDGSRYNGWQKQKNTQNTIQEKLESTFSKYFNSPIDINGSGRTDAGVHAKGQVINFKLDSQFFPHFENTPDYYKNLLDQLNSYLPADIRLLDIIPVDSRFHARLNAQKKIYRYSVCISDRCPVFDRKYVMHLNTMPDLQLMKKAAELLCKTFDMAGFSDTKTNKSTIRTIESVNFTTQYINNASYIHIDYLGDGFLYHTIRLITGTLLSIGLGQSSIEIIDQIILSKNRKQVPFMAPAEGLFLMNVFY